MTPLDQQIGSLRARHQELERRLTLLAADPDLDAERHEVIEAWRDHLDVTRIHFEWPLSVAFLAQVGRGKSTLISVATGLHLPIQGSPQGWSVLPVGDGRTTLGETRIYLEDRADIALEVEPVSERTLRTEVRLFAEDLWRSAHSAAPGTRGSEGAVGEELYDLLRAWLEPDPENRRASLRLRAESQVREEDLVAELITRLDLPGRCRAYSRSFSADEVGKAELQTTLQALMDGELPGAPAPRVTTLRIPKRNVAAGIHAILDTQGLESSDANLLLKARGDLQGILSDPNVLCVLCSEFESAPDNVTIEFLKALGERRDEFEASPPIFRVLIVDRREGNNPERARRQRSERVEQCRDRLRRADLGFSIPDAHVVALDARREADELNALLRGMAEEARAGQAARWAEDMDEVEQAIGPLGELLHTARLAELDLRLWWAWDAATAGSERVSRDPFELLGTLIRRREPWIKHWSHLHAAIRRRGRYHRLDLVELAAGILSVISSAYAGEALHSLSEFLASPEMKPRNDAEKAHLRMRRERMRAAVNEYRQELHRAWEQVLAGYFEASRADALWRDCYLHWGRGTGHYVKDVAMRFEREGSIADLRLVGEAAPAPPESRFQPRPPLLRLSRVDLENFRGVKEGSVDLADLSVFVGENGLGKTGWLEAIAAGIGALLPEMGAGDAPSIGEADVRQVIRELGGVPDRQLQLPMVIGLVGVLQGRPLQWTRRIVVPPDEADAGEIDAVRLLAREIGEEIRAHRTRQLPVLCYYGTQRLWPAELAADEERREVGSRMDGYRDCLAAASTQRHLLDWVRKFTLVELQRKQPVVQLRAIERAVVTCVEGAQSFRYDLALEALCLTMENGTIFSFRMLSDGFRNVVAMVADIAWRASVLNPDLGVRAPELAEGVVLIDEIDLHLHPRWQRRVLADLRRAFPRIQFITTTHSPFIIQSLRPGQLVNLDPEVPEDTPYADESPEDITEAIMGVDMPQRSWRREKAAEVAERYYTLLDQLPQADEVELARLKAKLDDLLAPYNDNPAYVAYLERKRALAEAKRL